MNTEEEFHQSQLEQQQMIEEALDECFKAGAPVDALRFLAWNAGATRWAPPPNVIQMNAHR